MLKEFAPFSWRTLYAQHTQHTHTRTHTYHDVFIRYSRPARVYRADVDANEKVCKSFARLSRAKVRSVEQTFVHTTRSKLEELTSKKVRDERPPRMFLLATSYHFTAAFKLNAK